MDKGYRNIINALKSTIPRNSRIVENKAAPINTIRQLLTAGANPNAEFEGKTILEIACYDNITDVVKLLIEYGVDMNRVGSSPKSEPAIYRVIHGVLNGRETNIPLLRLLLNNGADPNSYDQTKISPLFEACRNQNADAVKLLLDYEANPNIQNKHGDTCVHMLLQHHLWEPRLRIVKILVESGADINIYNNEGHTALDMARMQLKKGEPSKGPTKGLFKDLSKELIDIFGDKLANNIPANNLSFGVNNATSGSDVIPFKSLHMEHADDMTFLTIPKGTLLYNSFVIDETEPSEDVLLKLMGGILPFSTGVTIGQNTIYIRSCLDQFAQKFFYSNPVGGVALGAVKDKFNATAVFETKRDLRVAVLMSPTDYHRMSGKTHPSKITCNKLDSKYCQCALINGENVNTNENLINGGGWNSNNNSNNINNNNNSNNNNNNNINNINNYRYVCEFAKSYDVCLEPPFLHKHSLDGHIAIAKDDSYDYHMKHFDNSFMNASLFGKKMHALNRILFDGGLSFDDRSNPLNTIKRGGIYGFPEIILHIFDTNWYGDKEKISITHTIDIAPESTSEDTMRILSKFLIDYNNDKIESLGFQTPLRLLGVSTAKQFHNFMTGTQKPNVFYGNPRLRDITQNFYVNHLTAFLDGDLRFFFDTRTGFLMNEKGVPNVQMEDGTIVSFKDLSIQGAPAMPSATLLEKSFAARKAGTFWNKSDCLTPKITAPAAAGAGAGQAGGKLMTKTRNILRKKVNNRMTRKNTMKQRAPVTVLKAAIREKASPHVMPKQIEDLYSILLKQVRESK